MDPNEEFIPPTEEQKAEYHRQDQERRQKYRTELLKRAANEIHVSRQWNKLFKFRAFDGGPRLVEFRALLDLRDGLTVYEKRTCRKMASFGLAEVGAALQDLPPPSAAT